MTPLTYPNFSKLFLVFTLQFFTLLVFTFLFCTLLLFALLFFTLLCFSLLFSILELFTLPSRLYIGRFPTKLPLTSAGWKEITKTMRKRKIISKRQICSNARLTSPQHHHHQKTTTKTPPPKHHRRHPHHHHDHHHHRQRHQPTKQINKLKISPVQLTVSNPNQSSVDSVSLFLNDLSQAVIVLDSVIACAVVWACIS